MQLDSIAGRMQELSYPSCIPFPLGHWLTDIAFISHSLRQTRWTGGMQCAQSARRQHGWGSCAIVHHFHTVRNMSAQDILQKL